MSGRNLFDALVASGIVGAIGEISFEMHGIQTHVKDSSVVGNIIQEWLMSFMDAKGILYRFPQNSQEFPDYFMSGTDREGLLEVKCFKKSPNFDIANFAAYCRSLTEKPYRLDADYLIFEYAVVEQGIRIENIWLKKVWEIAGNSERAAVNIQWKQNSPVNIRPSVWYSQRAKFRPFETRKDFVEALKTVLHTTQWYDKVWFDTVADNYREQTGREL